MSPILHLLSPLTMGAILHIVYTRWVERSTCEQGNFEIQHLLMLHSSENIPLTTDVKGGSWRGDRRPPNPCARPGRGQPETKSNSRLATSLQRQIGISGGFSNCISQPYLSNIILNCISPPAWLFETICLGCPCWETANQLLPVWPILLLLSQVFTPSWWFENAVSLQRQSCPASLRSSMSAQNYLPSTLCEVCFSFLPLINTCVRSHSTEETCKGVRVQKDASDSWFDAMSDIFSFSWSAAICTLVIASISDNWRTFAYLIFFLT